MLNEETCQVLKLNGRSLCLIRSIKEINKILDEIFSFGKAAVFEDLLHYFNKLVAVDSHIGIGLKSF